jgi:hypothetical protein
MKRKGDALGDVITKHLKGESNPLDLHVVECISKLLNDLEFCALMAVSKHFYQCLKTQRVERIFYNEPKLPPSLICKAYHAVIGGIESIEFFKAWHTKNAFIQYPSLNYIYQATGIPQVQHRAYPRKSKATLVFFPIGFNPWS